MALQSVPNLSGFREALPPTSEAFAQKTWTVQKCGYSHGRPSPDRCRPLLQICYMSSSGSDTGEAEAPSLYQLCVFNLSPRPINSSICSMSKSQDLRGLIQLTHLGVLREQNRLYSNEVSPRRLSLQHKLTTSFSGAKMNLSSAPFLRGNFDIIIK